MNPALSSTINGPVFVYAKTAKEKLGEFYFFIAEKCKVADAQKKRKRTPLRLIFKTLFGIHFRAFFPPTAEGRGLARHRFPLFGRNTSVRRRMAAIGRRDYAKLNIHTIKKARAL